PERPGLIPPPVADVGGLREAASLPPLRGRILRADPEALPQRGESVAHGRGVRAGARGGHLSRDRDAARRGCGRHARGVAREAEGGSRARWLSSTSRRRSTTRTASRTWATRGTRSARTATRGLGGSEAQ